MMAGKEPVVLTWMSISLGVIAVIAGIAGVSLADRVTGLGIPPFLTWPIGAAIGVGAWFALVFRKKNKE